MSYATVTDLQDRLGAPRLEQLTDLDDPPSGAVVPAVAQKALDDAGAEIDGYLVGRYALPLAPAPAVLTVHCVTIAHYRLLGSAADEVTREAYRAVIRMLEMIARGDVQILAPGAPQPASAGGSVQFDSGAKDWGRESSTADDGGRRTLG